MARLGRLIVVVAGLASAGCQCCSCTERFADFTDKISSRECRSEIFYSPSYDLTRIGRRDWCQCGFNSWLCPCRCDRCNACGNGP